MTAREKSFFLLGLQIGLQHFRECGHTSCDIFERTGIEDIDSDLNEAIIEALIAENISATRRKN